MADPELMDVARQRAVQNGLSYQGALLPQEAYRLWTEVPGVKLIDVRTRAELNYVGRIPGAVEIEWQTYPDGELNSQFLAELQAQVPKDCVALFICRSGARSHSAADAARAAGYQQCFNVLEGFQGDGDAQKHRDTVGGWRAAGLPWYQS